MWSGSNTYSLRTTTLLGAHLIAGVIAVMCVVTGCGTSREAQLERVALDWCQTIGASQVIPVYPLTEDIQPGDVFLVQTTVNNQRAEYKKKGYLPLDNHIARIDPSGYHDFYDRSFDARKESVLPGTWQLPGVGRAAWEPAPRAAFPTYSFAVSKGAGLNMAVPISGVPVGLSLLGTQSANGSISIERARTMGIDMFSAYGDLQAWAAANQTFVSAYAPAATNASRARGMFGWLKSADREKKNYLRMITRIYATGKMDVALSDARSGSGGADVGAARPVDLVAPKLASSRTEVNQTTLANYRANVASLNAMLAESFKPTRLSGSSEGLDPDATDAKTKATAEVAAAEKKRLEEELEKQRAEVKKAQDALKEVGEDATKKAAAEAALAAAQGKLDFRSAALAEIGQLLPGGSLRVTAASSRFIALQQEFDPPLVLGYLAFDVEIFPDGSIGAPVPTQSLIDPVGGISPNTQLIVDALYPETLPEDVEETLADAQTEDAKHATQRLNALGVAFVPSGPQLVYEQGNDGVVVKQKQLPADYKGFKSYVSNVLPSGPLVRALRANKDFKLTGADGTVTAVKVNSPDWKALQDIVVRREGQLAAIKTAPEHRAAVRTAGATYLRLQIAKLTPESTKAN